MFGFLRERRARTIVAQVCPDLADGIGMLSPVDRAGVLAIANALLEVTAEAWGKEVLRKPASLGKDTISDIVCKLADHHSRVLKELLEPLSDRGMEDISYAQAMREIRASEIVIATLGAPLTGTKQPSVAQSWKLLWAARGEAAEAAQTLMRYAKHAGADPVPRTKARRGPPKQDDIARLASTLPPFFQKRRPAKPAGARA